jgi:hypothetical protein
MPVYQKLGFHFGENYLVLLHGCFYPASCKESASVLFLSFIPFASHQLPELLKLHSEAGIGADNQSGDAQLQAQSFWCRGWLRSIVQRRAQSYASDSNLKTGPTTGGRQKQPIKTDNNASTRSSLLCSIVELIICGSRMARLDSMLIPRQR